MINKNNQLIIYLFKLSCSQPRGYLEEKMNKSKLFLDLPKAEVRFP